MRKIIFIIAILLLTQLSSSATIFDDLKKVKKTSYLDFVLLKLEQRLIQRHGLLGVQAVPIRVQYESIGSQVDFSEEEQKIIISIIGVMDKRRYSQKKYKPKMSDCNVLRNLLLYGKYGYNLIFQKRTSILSKGEMEDIFVSRFLNNLTLSEKEKNYILENTIVKSQVIDPVRGNNIICSGKVADHELR